MTSQTTIYCRDAGIAEGSLCQWGLQGPMGHHMTTGMGDIFTRSVGWSSSPTLTVGMPAVTKGGPHVTNLKEELEKQTKL